MGWHKIGGLWQQKPAPSYAHRPGVWSGVHRLIETLPQFGGAAPTTSLGVIGLDATLTTWTARLGGVVFTRQAGAPSLGVESPYLGLLDGGIKGDGTAYYTPPNATALDIADNLDIWCEFVAIAPAVPPPIRRLAGKLVAGAGSGWQTLVEALSAFKFYLYASGATALTAPNHATGQLGYWSFAVNRNEASANGGFGFLNGVAGAGVDCSARATGVSNNTVAMLLDVPNYTGPWGDNLFCFALHLFPAGSISAGAPGAAEMLALHKARFAMVSGSRPIISWAGETFPAAAGSTSPAFQRKVTAGVTALHLMGAGAPRFERVLDADGREFVGALVEPGTTNTMVHNTNLPGWVAVRASTSATPVLCPDGITRTTVTISEDGNPGTHYITQGAGNEVIGTKYCMQFIFTKTPQRSWMWFQCAGAMNNASGVYCYVNLNTGKLGATASAGGTKFVEPMGANRYRVVIAWTGTGTLAMSILAGPATGDGGASYQGLTQEAITAVLGQLETGVLYPTSPIITTAVGAARVADALRYTLTSCFGAAQGGVRFRCLFPANFPTGQPRSSLLAIGNPGATDYFLLYREVGENTLRHFRAPDAAGDTTGVSLLDNRPHEVLLTWLGTRMDVWVDGVLTRVTMTNAPTGMTQLYVANSYGAGQCGPALVGDVKVYPRYQPSWTDRGSGFTVIS